MCVPNVESLMCAVLPALRRKRESHIANGREKKKSSCIPMFFFRLVTFLRHHFQSQYNRTSPFFRSNASRLVSMRFNRRAFAIDSKRLNSRIASKIPPEIYHGNIDSILHEALGLGVSSFSDLTATVCCSKRTGSLVGGFHIDVSPFK